MPPEERETLGAILRSLKDNGIPDTVGIALTTLPSPIEYRHFF
jgi:hypothetical protein